VGRRFELRLIPTHAPGRAPATISLGHYAVPVQGRTYTAAAPFAFVGDGEPSALSGATSVVWPHDMTVTSVAARLPGTLTGGGGSSVDFGFFDIDGTGAFMEDLFASVGVGQASAFATGELTLLKGNRYSVHFRRVGTPQSSIAPTGMSFGYSTAAGGARARGCLPRRSVAPPNVGGRRRAAKSIP
jgi:hypothetical protein